MSSQRLREVQALDLDTDPGLKQALEIILAGVLDERTPFEERTEEEKEELRLWVRAWITLGMLPALRRLPSEQGRLPGEQDPLSQGGS